MPPTRERRWWTSEEDDLLRNAVQAQLCRDGGVTNWNDISSSLIGRTNKDCRKRWSKVQEDIQKGVWTRDEDERLQHALQQLGFKWSRVATMVRSRNADQCAKRWQHVLRPDLKHTEWTPEEDEKLLAAIKTYGNNWKQVSVSVLPDRSNHDIRNRSLLLGRRSRSRTNTREPAQLQTPISNDEILCGDENEDNRDSSGSSEGEGEYIDNQDILALPDLDLDFGSSPSITGSQHFTPLTPGSAGNIFDQSWFGQSEKMQQQGPMMPDNEWLSPCNPFEGASITPGSEFPWWDNAANQHYFPSVVQPNTRMPGKPEDRNAMDRLHNIDIHGIHGGDNILENEQKGSVTLTLDQVDPSVAHEIMGSMLKHSAGLKVQYIINNK